MIPLHHLDYCILVHTYTLYYMLPMEMRWCGGATLTSWLLLVSEMKDGSIEKAINNFIDNNFLGEIEKIHKNLLLPYNSSRLTISYSCDYGLVTRIWPNRTHSFVRHPIHDT